MSLRIVACSLALLAPLHALAAGLPAQERAAIVEAVATGARPAVDRAIGRLRYFGEPQDVLRAVSRLATEGNPRARQNATYVLEVLAPAAFAGTLIGVLADEDPVVREQACKGLGKMKAKAAVRGLMRAAGDSAPVVRREAVRALGRIGDKTALRAVSAVLDDVQSEPRLAAIVALGDLRDPRAVPKLLPLLQDPSETTRLAAARSLAMLGNAEGRKYAERLLESAQPAERRDGIRLIEEVRLPWARQALLALLRDKALTVQIAAARALAGQGDGRGVEWLVLTAETADVEEKLKLETAIEEIGLTPADRKRILSSKRK